MVVIQLSASDADHEFSITIGMAPADGTPVESTVTLGCADNLHGSLGRYPGQCGGGIERFRELEGAGSVVIDGGANRSC